LRQAYLSKAFFLQAGRITDRPARKALVHEVRLLEKANALPDPVAGDLEVQADSDAPQWWIRHVPNQNLWIWYNVTSTGDIDVRAVTTRPPIPS
jgi:hypothetical protein